MSRYVDAYLFQVTGCSSGIGEALAQYISKTSNRVVATARNPSSMSNIPDKPNVLKLKLDVTSIPSIEDALSETLAQFQRIDVVVNNAGYTLVGDTEAAGDAEARALLDTNFWGCVDVTKRALGIMRDDNAKNDGQRGGVILNISSMGGWFGFPACSFYHASKFAMEGWTEAVARELPSDWNSEHMFLQRRPYGDLHSSSPSLQHRTWRREDQIRFNIVQNDGKASSSLQRPKLPDERCFYAHDWP